MTTLSQNIQSALGGRLPIRTSLRDYIKDNITRSWLQAVWVALLAYVTLRVVMNQAAAAPITTAIILAVWLLTIIVTLLSNLARNHTPATFWLSRNLYNSLANVMITLVIVLLLVAAARGFYDWAITRATFSTDPEAVAAVQAEMQEQLVEPGANWGAVRANLRNLMVFRFPREETWRIYALLLWNALLLIPSGFVYRKEVFRRSKLRTAVTILWLLTPIIAFILLYGFGESGPLRRLNPDIAWGGLLLTLIIAFFGIVASFPLGLLLALGRRSQIRGIPQLVIWGAAIALTGYYLVTSTISGLREASGIGQTLFSLWPLLILLAAYLFNRSFRGNVIALLSTVYIEVIRGVPLITILFTSIILFPIFLPPGMEILSTWRVLVAVALFAAAYLAENIRGGLQAIPKGQYEAADALGISTFRKYQLIILPQALRSVIPAIVGQFIGLYMDTTLVGIVGLIELLGIANLISSQPDWLGVRREPYVFIAVIYFVGNLLMATYSRRLEKRLGVGER